MFSVLIIDWLMRDNYETFLPFFSIQKDNEQFKILIGYKFNFFLSHLGNSNCYSWQQIRPYRIKSRGAHRGRIRMGLL